MKFRVLLTVALLVLLAADSQAGFFRNRSRCRSTTVSTQSACAPTAPVVPNAAPPAAPVAGPVQTCSPAVSGSCGTTTTRFFQRIRIRN